MDASRTTEALTRNYAATAALGVMGTPATLIGRTLALGLVPSAVLARILDDEEA
jgi:protein-disulfide isomerase